MASKGFLLTADIHLTAAAVDEYRWDIFDLLTTQAQLLGVSVIVLAGDLPDRKDKHPSTLVNRLTTRLRRLRDEARVRIVIVMGNHCYFDHNNPFFGFLNEITGIEYISKPEELVIGGCRVLVIPHQKSWDNGTDWRRKVDLNVRRDYIIAHQTFCGSLASNGDKMDGVPTSMVAPDNVGGAKVLSGDIHVPQTIGNITYVGAPHPVAFGDDFEPRVMYVTQDSLRSIPNAAVLARPMLRLNPDTIDSSWDGQLFEGDQCKVQLSVPRADMLDTARYRKDIEARIKLAGATCHGFDVNILPPPIALKRQFSATKQQQGNAAPKDVLEQYCSYQNIDERLRAVGRELL